MSSPSVCSDRFLDIPPRKQQTRHHLMAPPDHLFSGEESLLLHKFLPSAVGDDSDSDDPYSSDHFRMYEFKVRRCTRSRSHDWTDCPFAHPGEKARRRDPRRHHYSGAVCPDYRRGGCGRGDSCEFAHGVFECWLHPARYRTEACKDGKHCKRKVCFFAHTPRQLRILPPPSDSSPPPQIDGVSSPAKKKFHHQHRGSFKSNNSQCCVFCSCSAHHSPTSTLIGISNLSPPMSPSYKEALTEIMTSLEAMHVGESGSSGGPISPIPRTNGGLTWLDVSPFSNGGDDQPQFVLSPTTPSNGHRNHHHHQNLFAGKLRYNNINNNNDDYYSGVFGDHNINDLMSKEKMNYINNGEIHINGGSNSDPDLGWVNELLM